jgi:hypothetical protein
VPRDVDHQRHARPAFSVLVSEREHPVLLPDWREGLAAFLAERAQVRG